MKHYLGWCAVALFSVAGLSAQTQDYYWQQNVSYQMAIDMDTETHSYQGTQSLTYTNHSPDTLKKVYYHLYFNAFQPGSMMDVRSRTIEDPDGRIGSRISQLAPNEQGYHKIRSLEQEGQSLDYKVHGTIMEVQLADPIAPEESTTFDMEFHSQVPVQIRRSGRNNEEGVDYSMAQWYPKLAEYDEHGWHADPYVQREFHGVFGDFDVKITIDSGYTLGGTGSLQNPQEIGHGYEDPEKPLERADQTELTWHFKAANVHDFMWAADPDFVHDTRKMEDGPTLHFLYQPYTPDSIAKEWQRFQPKIAKAFRYMNDHFGQYPYEQYSVIQGGDGGMEYPMATLVTGDRNLGSLVGVTCHELAHSWYHAVLATNENMHPWMDEGMTVYASSHTMNHVMNQGKANPLNGSYEHYKSAQEHGYEEPMSTHADLYTTNRAYSLAAYSKGALFIQQLHYLMGKKAFDKGMKQYFQKWQFKHPYPRDFKQVMEEASGQHLGWFFNLWLNTTRTIDYTVQEVQTKGDSAHIRLQNQGKVPMPMDIRVTFAGGAKADYHIPLEMMYGVKKEALEPQTTLLESWPWPYPSYEFAIPLKDRTLKSVVIDPTDRLADVEKANNRRPSEESIEKKGQPVKSHDP